MKDISMRILNEWQGFERNKTNQTANKNEHRKAIGKRNSMTTLEMHSFNDLEFSLSPCSMHTDIHLAILALVSSM